MKRSIFGTLAALMLAGTAMIPALAKPVDIMLADFLLFRVCCSAPGMTVELRADAIQARANDLLVLGGFDLSTIRVKSIGRDAAIYANGRLLVTVDQCTARHNGITPIRLAKKWTSRLRVIYPDVMFKVPSIKTRQGG
jgi:hypothetical protein